MRFFHLSDLHIGAKLVNRDLREDQEYVFDQIITMAGEYNPAAVVIAGDIYDKAIPSAESAELLDAFVSGLNRAAPAAEIMIISGNHDSGPRLNLFRSILSRQKLHIVGLPPSSPKEGIEKVTLEDEYGQVHFYLLPFVKPSMVKQIVGTDPDGCNLSYNASLCALLDREKLDDKARNVIVSHQFYLPAGSGADAVERMDSETVTVGNIDSVNGEILRRFDYAALGHIHKPMPVNGLSCRYSGTPLAYSVSEAEQQKGVVMVDLKEKGEIETAFLPLRPMRRVRVIRGELEAVLSQACEDFVSIVLTDKADLDVIDMQDRLRYAFPNLLEVRRETMRTTDYSVPLPSEAERDPFELCAMFLKDMDEQERTLLRDVINSVLEVN